MHKSVNKNYFCDGNVLFSYKLVINNSRLADFHTLQALVGHAFFLLEIKITFLVCQYPYIEKKIAKKKKYYSSLPQIIASVLETCNKCFLCFVSSFFRLRNIFPPYDKMVKLSIKGLDYHGVLE